MEDIARRAASIIEAYDAQGWHRTGTAVDRASAEWLAGVMRGLGLSPTLEHYALRRLEPRVAAIEIEGRSVPGLPLFDAPETGEAGVEGTLGPAGSDADVGVVVLGEGAPAAGRLEQARRDQRQRAVVAVTIGSVPGIVASNASRFNEPYGSPVLQIGGEARAWLDESAERKSRARVLTVAARMSASTANVVARVEGSDRGLAPLMVTTPRSGWWHCAGERGGGLACWLEVARALAEKPPRRDVWFVAFSGHELGHLGCDAFLARRPELVKGAKAWVHFGANIGAAQDPGVRVSASDADDLGRAVAALEEAGVRGVTCAPAGRVLGLESEAVHSLGGRCVSLLGANALFHMEADRWPVAVDPDSVARQSTAFTNLIAGLVSGD